MEIIKDNSQLLLFGQRTKRLIFRKVEHTDFDTWLQFCADPDSLKYIFSASDLLTKNAMERCQAWFDKVYNRYQNNLGGMNALIEAETGIFVGQCGLLVQTVDEQEELEIGYSLMPAFRGKGFAREAAIRCKEYAFEHKLADSLISIIHVENTASAQVALANGMKLDKTTQFHDNPVNIFRIHKP